MSIIYRPARREDLDPALKVIERAINDLRTRHGFAAVPGARVPAFQAFCLERDPRGLWVAEAERAIVGFGFAWMLDKFWFLSQLFIEPAAQAQGVGQRLLAKTLELAEENGADNRALITFPYNTAATALYIRSGLYPREPLYRMSAPAAVVAQNLPTREAEFAPIAPSSFAIDSLDPIDDAVLGVRRSAHHRFQLSGFAARAGEIRVGGTPAGYAYISAAGHIGPLAVVPGADPKAAVAAALGGALETKPARVSMVVPGRADSILELALALGFRIDEPYVLMSARPFGDWRNYLPSNPGYM